MLLLVRKKLQDKIKRSTMNRMNIQKLSCIISGLDIQSANVLLISCIFLRNCVSVDNGESSNTWQRHSIHCIKTPITTCWVIINTEQHLFTWKHKVFKYLCSSCSGIYETNMCILQGLLAMVSPQSESTQRIMDICCHLVKHPTPALNSELLSKIACEIDSYNGINCPVSLHRFDRQTVSMGYVRLSLDNLANLVGKQTHRLNWKEVYKLADDVWSTAQIPS